MMKGKNYSTNNNVIDFIIFIVILILFMLCQACTTKKVNISDYFGATKVIYIDKDRRLINATWQGKDLWIFAYDEKKMEYIFYQYKNNAIFKNELIIKTK